MGEKVLNKFALRAVEDDLYGVPQVAYREGSPLDAFARKNARRQGLYEEERSMQFLQGMDEMDDEFED